MNLEQPIDPLFTAEKTIEGGFIPNEATLVSLVLDEKLAAYDHSGKILVDIDSKKQIFAAIQELCEPVIEKNVVLKKASTSYYTKQSIPEHRGTKTYRRVQPYTRAGEWILPWSALKEILSEEVPKEEWPIINIPESQYLAIKAGWNADRDSEVIRDSFFKKSELDALQFKEGKPNGAEIDKKEDIGASERETWLKVILLITYSLGVELHEQQDDIFTKQGQKKISPDRLAEFLKYEAGEMFKGHRKPEHRLGKSTIREILDEAEERLSPDIFNYIEKRISA